MRDQVFTTLLSVFLLAGNTPTTFHGPLTVRGSGQGQTGSASSEIEVSRLNESIADLYKRGKYDDALLLAKRVLEIEQKAYGSSDAHVAVALHNLAEIYLARKNSNDAESLLEQALAIYDKGPERESLLASNALERLASLAYKRHDYTKAALLLERSLAVREKLFGKDDLKVAETLWGLANVRAAEHCYDVAKPLYIRALTVKEAKLGTSNPNTVEAMKNFACVDRMSGNPTTLVDSSQEDEIATMVAKSYCWLGGLKDDCDTSPFGKSQGVFNGKALRLPIPPYPPQARDVKASGPVIVAVLIDESGRVLKAKAVCDGHPALIPVSLAAAREAKFEPTTIGGKPVQVTAMITYNFMGRRR